MGRRKSYSTQCALCHSDEPTEWHDYNDGEGFLCDNCYKGEGRKRMRGEDSADSKPKKSKAEEGSHVPKAKGKEEKGPVRHRHRYKWGRGTLTSQELLFIMTGVLRYLLSAERETWNKAQPWDRWLISQFLKLPPREEFSDYYQATKCPMDIDRIVDRIAVGQYTDIHQFQNDLEYVFYNAMKYYDPSTQLYQDAQTLQQLFESFQDNIVESLNAIYDIKPVRKSEDVSEVGEQANQILDALKEAKNPSGQRLADSFMRLPSAKNNPGYYEIVATPIDVHTIEDKISNKEYVSLKQFISDVETMLSNAKLVYGETNRMFKDAVALGKVFEETLEKFQHKLPMDGVEGDLQGPSVIENMTPETIKQLYKERLTKWMGDTVRASTPAPANGRSRRGSKTEVVVEQEETETKKTTTKRGKQEKQSEEEQKQEQAERRESVYKGLKKSGKHEKEAGKSKIETASVVPMEVDGAEGGEEGEARATRGSKKKTKEEGGKGGSGKQMQKETENEKVEQETGEGIPERSSRRKKSTLALEKEETTETTQTTVKRAHLILRGFRSEEKEPEEKGEEEEEEGKATRSKKSGKKSTEEGGGAGGGVGRAPLRIVLGTGRGTVRETEGNGGEEEGDGAGQEGGKREGEAGGGRTLRIQFGKKEKEGEGEGQEGRPKRVKAVMGRNENKDGMEGSEPGRTMPLRVKALIGKEAHGSDEKTKTGEGREGREGMRIKAVVSREAEHRKREDGVVEVMEREAKVEEGMEENVQTRRQRKTHTEHGEKEGAEVVVQEEAVMAAKRKRGGGEKGEQVKTEEGEGSERDGVGGGEKMTRKKRKAEKETKETVVVEVSQSEAEHGKSSGRRKGAATVEKEKTSQDATEKEKENEKEKEKEKKTKEKEKEKEEKEEEREKHIVKGKASKPAPITQGGGGDGMMVVEGVKSVGQAGEAVGGHVGEILRKAEATEEWTLKKKSPENSADRLMMMLRRGQLLWHFLDTALSPDGQPLIEPLRNLKSVRSYRECVADPLDMESIWRELSRDVHDMQTCKTKYPGMKESWCRACQIKKRCVLQGYRDMQKIHEDFTTLCLNAQYYYQEGSKEYIAASHLLQLVDRAVCLMEADDACYSLVDALLVARDHEGDTLCQDFCILPTRSELPAYYKTIKNPIELYQIEKKILGGSYLATALSRGCTGPEGVLELLTADINLMVDNALEFNDPDSLIYKNAERIRTTYTSAYARIVKTDELSQAQNRTRLSYEAGLGVNKKFRVVYNRPKHGEAPPPSKVSLKKSADTDKKEGKGSKKEKTKSKGGVDEEQALRAWEQEMEREREREREETEAIQKAIREVFEVVTNTMEGSRKLCESVWTGPGTDLGSIQAKVEAASYEDLDKLVDDLRAHFKAIRKSSQEGTTQHQDSQTLWELARSRADELQKTTARKRRKHKPLPPPPTTESSKELHRAMETLYKSILKAKYQGYTMSEPFLELPDKSVPFYYETVKQPIAMDIIRKRMDAKPSHYRDLDSFAADFELMFSNAEFFNEPSSDIHQDAGRLRQIFIKKRKELEADMHKDKHLSTSDAPKSTEADDHKRATGSQKRKGLSANQLAAARAADKQREKPKGPITDRDLTVGLMTILLNMVVGARGEDGRQLAGPLMNPPAEVVKVPITLESIVSRCREGLYEGMAQLYADMYLLFTNAYAIFAPQDQVHADVLTLHKIFLGSYLRLWRPYQQEQEVAKERDTWRDVCRRLQSAPKPSAQLAHQADDAQPPSEEQCEPELESNGRTIRVGQYVYLPSGVESAPHIVCVQRLWIDDADEPWLWGTWSNRPYQCNGHIAKYHPKEVFSTTHTRSNKLSLVLGTCHVMQASDWCQYVPKDVAPADTYLCEYSYHDKRGFEKLRKWALGADKTPAERGGVAYEARGEGVEVVRECSTLDWQYRAQWIDGMDKDLNIVLEGEHGTAGCTYYRQLTYQNTPLKIGDYVYLMSQNENLPFVQRIEKLWKDRSGGQYVHGSWYLRPYETSHKPTQTFYARELVRERQTDTNPIQAVMFRVAVLLPKDYVRGRMYGIPEEDVYVWESVYDSKMRQMKKAALAPFTRNDTQLSYEDGFVFLSKPIESIPRVESPLVAAMREAGEAGTVAVGGDEWSSSEEEDEVHHDEDSARKRSQVARPDLPISLPQPILEEPIHPVPAGALVYYCRWEGCRSRYLDQHSIGEHLYGHLDRSGDLACHWMGCDRAKEMSSRTNLMGHIRRLHVFRDDWPNALCVCPPPPPLPPPYVPKMGASRFGHPQTFQQNAMFASAIGVHRGRSIRGWRPITPQMLLRQKAALRRVEGQDLYPRDETGEGGDLAFAIGGPGDESDEEEFMYGPMTIGRALARVLRASEALQTRIYPDAVGTGGEFGEGTVKHTDEYMLFRLGCPPIDWVVNEMEEGEGNESESDSESESEGENMDLDSGEVVGVGGEEEGKVAGDKEKGVGVGGGEDDEVVMKEKEKEGEGDMHMASAVEPNNDPVSGVIDGESREIGTEVGGSHQIGSPIGKPRSGIIEVIGKQTEIVVGEADAGVVPMEVDRNVVERAVPETKAAIRKDLLTLAMQRLADSLAADIKSLTERLGSVH